MVSSIVFVTDGGPVALGILHDWLPWDSPDSPGARKVYR